MAINFLKRSFSYLFFIIGKILSNYINFAYTTYNLININLFAYIIINKYLFDKLYKIIIDINISKYFTTGYK